MKPRINRILFGVNMALGHDGLTLLIKKEAGIDVRTLNSDEMVICINAAQDRLKAIGGGGVALGYLKMPNKRKLMREAIQFLPRVFGGEGFTYDDACRQVIEKTSWGKQLSGPLGTKFVKTFVKEAVRPCTTKSS